MSKRKKRLRLKRSLVRRMKMFWAFSKMLVTFHIYLVHVPLNDTEMLSLRAADNRYKRFLSGDAEAHGQQLLIPLPLKPGAGELQVT